MSGHKDHTREKLKKNEKWLVIVLVSITIICGTIGFRTEERSLLDSLYLTAQLFIIHSGAHDFKPNVFLEIARWIAAALMIYAGIKVYMLLLSQNVKSWFFRKQNHIIIIGNNDLSYRILKDLQEDYIVLIGKQEEKLNIRTTNKHLLHFDTEKVDHAILRQAGLSHAREIYILTLKDDTNISLANVIMRTIEKEESGEITIWIRIDDKEKLKFYKHFHQHISPGNMNQAIFNLNVFNFHEITAQRLVDEYSPDIHLKILPGSPPVHTVIFGNSPIAEYLFEESLNMYHFINLKKNSFTWVTGDPEAKKKEFHYQFPDISQTCDIHFKAFTEFFSDIPDNLTLCFLCDEDYIMNIHLGVRLRSRYFQEFNDLNTPEIICLFSDIQDIETTMPDLNSQCKKANLRLINLENYSTMKRMIDTHREWDKIAISIHKSYNSLPQADFTSSWSSLSDAEKDLNRYPARHLRVKLRILGFDIDYKPDAHGEELILPDDWNIKSAISRMEHNRWRTQKILEGYTSVKDRSTFPRNMKTVLMAHPDIVKFEDLSLKDIEKDWITYPTIVESSKIVLKKI